MKKPYFYLLLLVSFANSQRLFISKSVTANGMTSSYLSQIDPLNGAVLHTHLFYQNTNPSLISNGLKFEKQSNAIYSFVGNRIFKNTGTNYTDQISFGGAVDAMYAYRDLIVINNRLFVTKSTNTGGMNYDLTLYELNKTDGSIISTRTWSIVYTTNGYGTTISESTNEIYNIIGNNLIKYNIITEESTIIQLPGTNLSTYYRGILFVQNRIFVRKCDSVINYMLELDNTTGAIIATHTLTSDLSNYHATDFLDYLPQTNEIVSKYYGLTQNQNENKILKFNIYTNTENVFNLPTQLNSNTYQEYYGRLIVTDTENNLSTLNWNQNNEIPKIKAVYNLLGQKVSENTKNQILIFEYENGQRDKKFNQ